MSISPQGPVREEPESVEHGAANGSDLARALDGDVSGFNRVVADHWRAVASYATRVLDESRDVGDDIAQEVFLLVWSGTLTWTGGGEPRPFLLGIARNLCLNRRRKRSVRTRLMGKVCAQFRMLQRVATPSEDLDCTELSSRLDSVLSSMPARRREVFVLVRGQGLSYDEVARVMQTSPQTVANQMSAALRDLRRAL
jgi:RNA polymerase sigma-70 factor, ECF subfamily